MKVLLSVREYMQAHMGICDNRWMGGGQSPSSPDRQALTDSDVPLSPLVGTEYLMAQDLCRSSTLLPHATEFLGFISTKSRFPTGFGLYVLLSLHVSFIFSAGSC